MTRKIYKYMVLVSLLTLFLVTTVLLLLFYFNASNQAKNEIQRQGVFLGKLLKHEKEAIKSLEDITFNDKEDVRISLINNLGEVQYDNRVDIKKLNNHLDREEVKEAFASGQGKSERYSDTLQKKTFYYCYKINENLLIRTSLPTDSIYKIFLNLFPYIAFLILLVTIFCFWFSYRLTTSIVKPINDFDFEKNNKVPYVELDVFLGYITAQKKEITKKEKELEEQSITIKVISENMEEGLLLLDKGGHILIANKKIYSVFDITEKIEGKNVISVIRNINFINSVNTALNGINDSMILDVDNKSYSVFLGSINNEGVLVLFADVTNKLKAEKIRQEFSANVSHELKTPLTSILGFSELIENKLISESDTQEIAKRIRAESIRLLNIIEDIIKLSELDETTNQELFTSVNMEKIAKDVVGNLERKAKESNIRLLLNCEGSYINANERLIYELLYNIIDNGIKYNKDGGIVEVTINNDKENVFVKIRDTGVGIPKEYFDRIFERFFCVDKSRSKKAGGTGLGLSIVKHIVNLHNGDICVDSKVDTGTEFNIRFDMIL